MVPGITGYHRLGSSDTASFFKGMLTGLILLRSLAQKTQKTAGRDQDSQGHVKAGGQSSKQATQLVFPGSLDLGPTLPPQPSESTP